VQNDDSVDRKLCHGPSGSYGLRLREAWFNCSSVTTCGSVVIATSFALLNDELIHRRLYGLREA
jgi:hypothetical protein